jgi:hypothetical protein
MKHIIVVCWKTSRVLFPEWSACSRRARLQHRERPSRQPKIRIVSHDHPDQVLDDVIEQITKHLNRLDRSGQGR